LFEEVVVVVGDPHGFRRKPLERAGVQACSGVIPAFDIAGKRVAYIQNNMTTESSPSPSRAEVSR